MTHLIFCLKNTSNCLLAPRQLPSSTPFGWTAFIPSSLPPLRRNGWLSWYDIVRMAHWRWCCLCCACDVVRLRPLNLLTSASLTISPLPAAQKCSPKCFRIRGHVLRSSVSSSLSICCGSPSCPTVGLLSRGCWRHLLRW